MIGELGAGGGDVDVGPIFMGSFFIYGTIACQQAFPGDMGVREGREQGAPLIIKISASQNGMRNADWLLFNLAMM